MAKADRPGVFLPGLRVAALVLVDGMAAASWKVSATSTKATLQIEMFKPWAAAVRREVDDRGRGPAAVRRTGREDLRRESDCRMSALLLLLGLAVIVFGVVALVAPVLPGVAIIYLGILIVAWADGFTRIGPVMLFVMLGLMLVALVADNVAALFGARRAGASAWGVFGAGVGALAGLVFGLPGVVLGPAVGALAFEYFRNPDAKKALRAGAGGFLGFLLGVIAKAVFGFLLIGLAVLAYVF